MSQNASSISAKPILSYGQVEWSLMQLLRQRKRTVHDLPLVAQGETEAEHELRILLNLESDDPDLVALKAAVAEQLEHPLPLFAAALAAKHKAADAETNLLAAKELCGACEALYGEALAGPVTAKRVAEVLRLDVRAEAKLSSWRRLR